MKWYVLIQMKMVINKFFSENESSQVYLCQTKKKSFKLLYISTRCTCICSLKNCVCILNLYDILNKYEHLSSLSSGFIYIDKILNLHINGKLFIHCINKIITKKITHICQWMTCDKISYAIKVDRCCLRSI
jgi:hypothetical protein